MARRREVSTVDKGVDIFVDPGVASAAADATGPAHRGAAAPARTPGASRAAVPESVVTVKVRVPLSLKLEFQALKSRLSLALGGVVIDDSQLVRVLLRHLLANDVRVLESVEGAGESLVRPFNRDFEAMEAFERSLCALVWPGLEGPSDASRGRRPARQGRQRTG